MYCFIVYFTDLETDKHTKTQLLIDLCGFDEEMLDHKPEYLFAWQVAAEKAYYLALRNKTSLDKIELLYC